MRFRLRWEYRATSLFSSSHWEHFFCPFVFNQPLGGLFIFTIFMGISIFGMAISLPFLPEGACSERPAGAVMDAAARGAGLSV
jgi:hypothetical protein